MRKTTLTATAIITAAMLAVAAPVSAGGPDLDVGFSGDIGAANNGNIGSGAYSLGKDGFDANSFGKSTIDGWSNSNICGVCEATTSLGFTSESVSNAFTNGPGTRAESYGFNEADWRTNVDKSLNVDFGGGYDFN
jgi:hypothetical protein